MPAYDTQKFLQHLEEKWAGRPCAQCGVAAWRVHDAIFELRQYTGANVVIGGPIVPVIPVFCANCGNTVLVNAILAEAVERPGAEVKR